ncbi:hypothetical protein G8C92_07360 [Paenibacillus donghaensis]|uniref:hypothetical protein n=1 Tax=Paenibacillus donghaensis TaxID=414771 RepID=UPI0018848C0D|nr:hypothetical protein [Paenibacillus donghaensis]MBE9913849.1 hypothetical protein [Paenibacillus donghaensis]
MHEGAVGLVGGIAMFILKGTASFMTVMIWIAGRKRKTAAAGRRRLHRGGVVINGLQPTDRASSRSCPRGSGRFGNDLAAEHEHSTKGAMMSPRLLRKLINHL